MFISVFTLIENLNRSLRENPKKINNIIFKNNKELVKMLNALLRAQGERRWRILAIFKDSNFSMIERFDLIDRDGNTHIVSDKDFTDWFDKRLKRRRSVKNNT